MAGYNLVQWNAIKDHDSVRFLIMVDLAQLADHKRVIVIVSPAAEIQPVFSFRPTICKKSKYILQKKYQRQPGTSEDGLLSSLPLPTDVFQRLQISSPDKSRLKNSSSTKCNSSHPRANQVPWIDVEYDDATCGFILQHFELPVAFT